MVQMCKAVDDPTTGNDTFAKLYGAANVYYNYSGTATCFDLDDDSDPHDLGDWTWQVFFFCSLLFLYSFLFSLLYVVLLLSNFFFFGRFQSLVLILYFNGIVKALFN